jgi:RNA polymerase sigma-70 factor (ECF subfamily)
LTARIGDAPTAEDILQSAYVKAIEHGSELRDEESTVAWFYRVLRDAVTDHYRRGATRAKALEAFGAEAVESYEPEFQAEACACINELIRDLKPEY